MGFSWSSYVAQETLLTVAFDSGLSAEKVIAGGRAIPSCLNGAFALATDDLMIFSCCEGQTLELAERFETAFAARGGVKHGAKDIDDSLTAVCVGVELVNGSHWWPPAPRLWQAILGIVDLANGMMASPARVPSFLGAVQWYDLPRRLTLSLIF